MTRPLPKSLERDVLSAEAVVDARSDGLGDRALADASRTRVLQAIRRALALVRTYRSEEGPGGAREQGCLAEVKRLRGLLSARRARTTTEQVAREGIGPGLAKGPGETRQGDDVERDDARAPVSKSR